MADRSSQAGVAKDYDYSFKVLLVGDSTVGKSCIAMRFLDGSFSETPVVTPAGEDFKVKRLDFDGKKVKLTIWDTAGQEKFRGITSSYYRGAHGVLVVYDVTVAESFNNCKNWLHDVDRYSYVSDAEAKVTSVLIGNKVDLEQRKVVLTDSAELFASEHKVPLHEVSAKLNAGIAGVFDALIRKMIANADAKAEMRRSSSAPERQSSTVDLSLSGVTAKKKSGGLCILV